MMERYPAYLEYWDSGIPWLGEIPVGWSAKRLKYIANVQPSNVDKKSEENEIPVLLCNYVDVYNNPIIDSEIEFMQATATQNEIDKFRLAAGDVVVTKDSESPRDIAVPAYVSKDFIDVLCGYHLTHIRPVAILGEYLFRLFQSTQFNGQFVVGANGVTRFGLPQHVTHSAVICIPSLTEQQAIARFLDYKTAQIDALIAKRESLLEKLAEKRTALITQAVTKGLDPNAPMKDSGVAWLGEIPAHWNKCHAKRVAEISYGVGGEIDRGLSEGTNLLSLPNVTKDGRLSVEEHPFCELDELEKSVVLLQKGDLLFNWRNGSSEHLGKTAYFNLDGEWTHVSFLLKLRFEPTYSDSRYFQYMLNSLRITGFFTSSKAGVNNTFNLNELANLWIICPPRDEQQAIANYLDQHTSAIDSMASNIVIAIDTLKEYRTALISNAVTGKIDVRNVALPEPPAAEVIHA
jgi:type I restriction enzyme S subunit